MNIQGGIVHQSWFYLQDYTRMHGQQSIKGLEVLIMVNIKITVIWDITKCTLIDMCQHMECICCFHLQGLP